MLPLIMSRSGNLEYIMPLGGCANQALCKFKLHIASIEGWN